MGPRVATAAQPEAVFFECCDASCEKCQLNVMCGEPVPIKTDKSAKGLYDPVVSDRRNALMGQSFS